MVKVEAVLKHRKYKPGDTYEVSEAEAAALTGIGLVKPANKTAEKAIDKVTDADASPTA